MRKSYIFLILIGLVGAAAFVLPAAGVADFAGSWGLVTGILALLGIAAFFFGFEGFALSS